MSEHIVNVLRDLYEIQFRSVGVRIPSVNAWEDRTMAYDARILLSNMKSDRLSFFLWLISVPLAKDDKNVYGYAEKLNGAIVSTAKMATRTLVAKEVAFQVGIVLGLSPCRNDCIMKEADNFEILINKPSTFCPTCIGKFNRLKLRYV